MRTKLITFQTFEGERESVEVNTDLVPISLTVRQRSPRRRKAWTVLSNEEAVTLAETLLAAVRQRRQRGEQ